ncbi:MAG: acetate/propionate family kinase [Candidatus Eremiobacteraeota bacterium]|nr:acetate/propionate family kinase [Candidatus Eremiobacteraeota bacterium]
MNVFVLNAGSSSVKAAYYEGHTWPEARDAAWAAEIRWSLLPSRAQLNWITATASGSRTADVDEHGGAVAAVLKAAMETFEIAPDIVGHRVVHGMSESRCAMIDARVRAVIESAAELAPLHNRAALAGIDAMAAFFPAVPQAADFDTAFHTTLPSAAAAYALPYDWFAKRGLRRYGFHGISHRYCAQRTAELLAFEPRDLRMVSAHLGNGCSLAAIAGGKSVDTTMGFTPLDGLMMGSRSGSVDPGMLLFLLSSNAYSVEDLDRILNKEAGLAGVSQVSEDVRDVIAAAESGAAPSKLALDIYVHRLSAGIAAMAASTGGIDALAFTGGVGEHSAYVRKRVCDRLAFMGVALRDEGEQDGTDREISPTQSTIRVGIVHAREEFAIARDVALLFMRTS